MHPIHVLCACLVSVAACAGTAPSINADNEKYSTKRCPPWKGDNAARSPGDLLIEGVVGIGETISDRTDGEGYREFIFEDEVLILKVIRGRAPASKIINVRQRLFFQPQGDLSEGAPLPGNRKYILNLSTKDGRYVVMSAQECKFEE